MKFLPKNFRKAFLDKVMSKHYRELQQEKKLWRDLRNQKKVSGTTNSLGPG